MNNLSIDILRDEIERGLQDSVYNSILSEYHGLNEFICYHMGWIGPDSGKAAQGKRLRPLFTLLSADAAGGDWRDAMGFAQAVEFLHNYSLVHDDIEDKSVTRRGRETLWHSWGESLAINTGDALISLAFRTLAPLNDRTSFAQEKYPFIILSDAAMALTGGQHLDISFENRREIKLEEYWRMVEGKTAALFAASSGLGAYSANVSSNVLNEYMGFGRAFGMAFQIKDDWLGIWGDSALTGKSNESDLMNGKKSLPVVFGLENSKKFRKKWLSGTICEEMVPEIAELLRSAGAESFIKHEILKWTNISNQYLENSGAKGDSTRIFREFVQELCLD